MPGTAFCNIIGIGLNGAKTNSLWFGMHFRYSSNEIPNFKLPFAVNVSLKFSLLNDSHTQVGLPVVELLHCDTI